MNGSPQPQSSPAAQDAAPAASLIELLNETRILLPGAEVFLAFLMVLPFQQRFEVLDARQRLVYMATFFATLLAVACFTAPAAYHRITRPIHNKERFTAFANALVVIGLAPASITVVLITYLVTSVVAPGVATVAAWVMAAVVVTLWWLVPLERWHERLAKTKTEARHGTRGGRHAHAEV